MKKKNCKVGTKVVIENKSNVIAYISINTSVNPPFQLEDNIGVVLGMYSGTAIVEIRLDKLDFLAWINVRDLKLYKEVQ